MLILAGVVAEALVAQPTLAVGARQLVRSRGVLLQAEQAERPAPFAGFFQRDDDVPVDQQPVYELQVLRSQPFYDWADTSEGLRDNLFKLFMTITLLLSLPVSYNTYHVLPFELPQLIIASNLGTLAVMIPFLLRLRVGWSEERGGVVRAAGVFGPRPEFSGLRPEKWFPGLWRVRGHAR